MIDGDGGLIINVFSMVVICFWKDIIIYVVVKVGVNVMIEVFVDVYGFKVCVNCIMFGLFLIDIFKVWDMDVFNKWVVEIIVM